MLKLTESSKQYGGHHIKFILDSIKPEWTIIVITFSCAHVGIGHATCMNLDNKLQGTIWNDFHARIQ